MYFWQTKSFYELEQFTDWLMNNEDYPIEIWFNGITYKFGTDVDKLFFVIGMDAYRNSLEEMGKDGGELGI